MAVNTALLVAAIGFITSAQPQNSETRPQNALSNRAQTDINPLDQLSSADIAVHVARMTGIEEAVAVTNQADSVNAQLSRVSDDAKIVSKPQVVSTDVKSIKDVKQHVAQDGDTVSSLATQYGVTSDSIRWSNDIRGDALQVGKALWIPPVNGFIYVVKDGDTPDSLAQKYKSSKDTIIAFNDAELSGLVVGKRIVIPDGVQPAPVRQVAYRSPAYSSGLAFGSSPVYGYNGYIRGYCTYYVASRIAVPTNWGNANTWDNGARASGWIVSATPRPGAIAQTNGMSDWGHVAIVEEVSADGTMIKYSDMNGIAGYNRVGYSDWVSARLFENYLFR